MNDARVLDERSHEPRTESFERGCRRRRRRRRHRARPLDRRPCPNCVGRDPKARLDRNQSTRVELHDRLDKLAGTCPRRSLATQDLQHDK